MTKPGLIAVDGEQLHVVVRGSTGRVVVLCSGLGGKWSDWDDVTELLATDHVVVRFDRPGLGSSPALTSDYTPTVRAEAHRITAVLDAVGLTAPVTIVGHSLGGFYAEGFARLYPDRTAAVLLLDSSVAEPAGRRLLPKRVQTATYDVVNGLSKFLGAVVRENNAYPDLGEEVLDMRRHAPISPVRVAVAVAIGRHRTPWANKWLAQQRGLGERLGVDLAIITPSGHRVMIDRPDETARLIRELSR